MKAQARLRASTAHAAALQGGERAAKTTPLPHKALIVARFGARAAHVPVVIGPAVAESLRRRGAGAASLDGIVFLPHERVGPDLVAHEVAHALQQLAGGAQPAPTDLGLLVERLLRAPVAPAGAPAEAEARASESTARSLPDAPGTTLPPGVVSLRRPDPPAGAAPNLASGSATSASAASEGAAAAPAPALVAATPQTADGDIAPTFAPPALVEPTLDPALAAQRTEAAAAAREALASAESPQAVMSAYAAMAPSVQAEVQPELGTRLGQASAMSNAGLGAATAAVAVASRGGDGPLPMPPPVVVPADVAEIDLGDAARPSVVVPDGPAQPVLRVDPACGPAIEQRFRQSTSPERIEESIDAVVTGNPGIATQVADRAGVPRDGANDPQRLDDALTSQRQQSSTARQHAAAAVESGPGPEQIVPRALDVSAPAPAFPGPQVGALQAAPEAQQLGTMGLPDAVIASFDQAAAGKMRASADASRQQMADTEAGRDTAHQAATARAEIDRQAAEQTADAGQRQAVTDQREAIQSERQHTVDEQNRHMAAVNAEAAQAGRDKRGEAEREVAAGQERIAARYDQAEHKAEAEVRRGEQRAEAERQRKKRESVDASWWDRAVNFIKDAFNALVSLVNDIFDAVRSAVTGLIDLARRAVVSLIEAVSEALQAIVSRLGEGLKSLVDGLLGDIFPELARALTAAIDRAVTAVNSAIDAVATALTDAVNAIAAALTAAVNALLDVFQAAINSAFALLQAALTGDWSGLLLKVLDAVLAVLGIDPAAFHALIAQASDAIAVIVNDPGQFVANMIEVVSGGIGRFADNFLDHLRRGVVGWLTGALGDIQIPSEWNLWTVLDLARQVMGLTWDFVRERAARLIGPANVARLEMMAGWIGTLITEGWQGLWTRLQQSLASLRDSVLASIRTFVMERVVMASITWLASLFNPVGALVKLVMTIWNIYQFVRGQLQRLFGIAQAVVGAISNIAHGVLDPGKQAVEAVLGNMVPVVIDLLMSLLGVTGVAAHVREIIHNLRQRIADAVDAMLQRVLATLRGGAPAAAGAAPGAAGGAARQIGHPVRIDVAEGEDHTLSIDRTGAGGATVMLRSDPRPLGVWLDILTTTANRETDDTKRRSALERISEARALLNTIDPLIDRAAAGPTAGAAAPTAAPRSAEEITRIEDRMGPVLKIVFDQLAGANAAFADRFREHIRAAHPQAQAMIGDLLRANAADWHGLSSWAQIAERLKTTEGLFGDPLDPARSFGGRARPMLEAAVPAELAGLAARVVTMVRTKVRENDSAVEYVTLKQALHQAILRDALEAAEPAMVAAARKAATELNAGSEVDSDLRLQVERRGLDFFLLAMGAGVTLGTITPQRFDELWESPGGANKEFIASRFRWSSGAHEWIPTNYIPDVLARARGAREEEGMIAAALWVKLQNEWRTPTELIIYDPATTPWERRVTIGGVTHTVPQGHSGAVYAKADDAGVSSEPQQQTIGQDAWHNELRARFDRYKDFQSNSRVAVLEVIDQIEAYKNQTVWKGDSTGSIIGFDEYYRGDRRSHMGVSALVANAVRSVASLEADFAQARGIIARVGR